METLKNIAKSTIALGIVGIVLAAISLPLAQTLGVGVLGEAGMKAAADSTSAILWTGAFFGGFGGLHAAVAPVVDWAFGAKNPAIAEPVIADCCKMQNVAIAKTQAVPQMSFVARLETERMKPESPTLSA